MHFVFYIMTLKIKIYTYIDMIYTCTCIYVCVIYSILVLISLYKVSKSVIFLMFSIASFTLVLTDADKRKKVFTSYYSYIDFK